MKLSGSNILSALCTAGLSGLPGQTLWQPYLDAAPDVQKFSQDPLGTLLSLLPFRPLRMLSELARSYEGIFLFLLAVLLLSFFLGESRDADLLELVSVAGCGVLSWGNLTGLAQQLCEKMTDWKSFLLGFLPVYSGVLTAGGETQAGTAACGLLLSGLCFLAQCTALWAGPLLKSYFAVSMACCISTRKGLSDGCRSMGSLLRKSLGLAGKLFAILLGLQRLATMQLDRTALRMGKLLTGSVPVIGDALSGAADAILAGMQLLKSALGLAGIALLGAEFVPLYLTLLLHLALLQGCILLCDLAENERCKALFSCLAEAVRCMAAVTALFFGLMAAGVTALMVAGGA